MGVWRRQEGLRVALKGFWKFVVGFGGLGD